MGLPVVISKTLDFEVREHRALVYGLETEIHRKALQLRTQEIGPSMTIALSLVTLSCCGLNKLATDSDVMLNLRSSVIMHTNYELNFPRQ